MRTLTLGKVAPERRHTAEIRHDVGYRLDDIVDVLLGCVLAESEAQGAVRDFVGSADSEEDVAWVKRAGGTRRAGRRANSLVVKQQEQRFSLDTLEAEVHI